MLEVLWREHPHLSGWYIADCGELRLVAAPYFWGIFEGGDKPAYSSPPMYHGKVESLEAAKTACLKIVRERLAS